MRSTCLRTNNRPRRALSAVAALLLAASPSILPIRPARAAGMQASGANRSIVFVIDTSTSMDRHTLSFSPAIFDSRLDQAKKALSAGIDVLSDGDLAGLHQYGGQCGEGGRLLVPPEAGNRDALRGAVTGLATYGETPTPEALRAAVKAFPPGAAEKILVLVSDGQSTCGDPCPVARELRQRGIDFKAHTVGFHTSGQAETEQACIASATGGTYFPVDDIDSLQEAIRVAVSGQPGVGGGIATATVVTIGILGLIALAYLASRVRGSRGSRGGGRGGLGPPRVRSTGVRGGVKARHRGRGIR